MAMGRLSKFVTACALGAAALTGTAVSGQAAPLPVSGVNTVAGSTMTTDVRYRGGGGYGRGYYGRGYGYRGGFVGPFVAGAAIGALATGAYGYGYGYPAYGYGYGYPVAYGYGGGYPYGYGYGYGYGPRYYGYRRAYYGPRYGFYGRGYGYGRGFHHAGYWR